MVKELAPLALYLRNVANRYQTMCIDEPEMNLHPLAQARLTEFMGMLVQAGVNVFMTTHSSYMVDHLALLSRAAGHPKPEEIEGLFFLENRAAFVPTDKMSVYLFENGKAVSILNEQGELNWQTFSSVSDKLMNISMRI